MSLVPQPRAGDSAGGPFQARAATPAAARTSPESERATSCAPPANALAPFVSERDHCTRCGVREPHRCAFATPVNVFCTRCARWVDSAHVCPAARLDALLASAHARIRGLCACCQTAHGGGACPCPVCAAHGAVLASHALPVDLSPPSREWGQP